jgi:D-alanyl-D-alanine carboxypeptidase/D-alanyl-D-alanine-endopeptidase (penicillin-binding protein 4)
MHLRLRAPWKITLCALGTVAGVCLAAGPLTAQSLSAAEREALQSWYRRTVPRTGDGAWGIAVATMDGRVLWSVNPELELVPASTTKVFTTGFARSRVGGHATVATRVVGSGQLGTDGRWIGPWAIDLAGDVTLERSGRNGPTLYALAKQLAERGVRVLDGPLALTSRSGPASAQYPAVWASDFAGQLYAPPIGPVTLHENTISVTLRPGAVGAAPTIVSAYPAGVDRMIRIAARTVAGSRRRLSMLPNPDGTWTLMGTVGRGLRSAGISAVAHDPVSVMAFAWGAALDRAGIRWEHRDAVVRGAVAGTPTLLAQVESAPLDTIAMEINRRSLNIGAELMLQWGAGSQSAGPALLTQHVRQVVGPQARVHLVDGSGLSELDRVSPMTQALYLARYPQRPGNERFPMLLPANGTGTLRRLRQGMSKGVVHAKTGTLDDAATLTGYLGRPDGIIVISLMYNGRRIHQARAAEWEFFRLLGAEGVNVSDAIDTRMGGTSTKGDR